MTKPTKKSKAMCAGCRNDFYNGKNNMNVKECWSFPKAKIVTRYAIGTWDQPKVENLRELTVLHCYHQDGTHYLQENALPYEAREHFRKQRTEAAKELRKKKRAALKAAGL